MADAKNPAGRAWKTLSQWIQLQRAEVVAVSHPKCGRTWLRVLIGKAVCLNHDLDDRLIFDERAISRRAGLPMPFFTHDQTSDTEGRHYKNLESTKYRYADKRVLFLHRDPRDVVVSLYFHAARRKQLFAGSISEFIRDPHYGLEKILTFYEQWERSREVPAAFHLVRYEDLHDSPVETLRGVLDFLGEETGDTTLRDAVEFASFARMRKMERSGYFKSNALLASDSREPESFKTRKGVVGGYREYLDEEDCEFIDQQMSEHSTAFGVAG